MKNKAKTYILLVAVLGVWGIIGCKMISTIHPQSHEVQSQHPIADFSPESEIKNDTFSIKPVSRDPFLGTIQKKTIASINNSPKNATLVWPVVTYGGMVKKQNADTQVFVMNIDNSQYLLKKGQNVNDVTLVRGNSKEVVVRYKNNQQTISLQK